MAPSTQTNPILSSKVILRTFSSIVGASGTLSITPPPPYSDIGDVPYSLVAESLMLMLSPYNKENGAAVNTDKGTVHCVTAITVASVPSQYVVSNE